ncbi:unnamed protein product, partial [marine sediment metagenome]
NRDPEVVATLAMPFLTGAVLPSLGINMPSPTIEFLQRFHSSIGNNIDTASVPSIPSIGTSEGNVFFVAEAYYSSAAIPGLNLKLNTIYQLRSPYF